MRKIIEANEFCKNGFVHIVDKVIVPLDNMSQIIKSNSNMSVFHGLIDRYATADYIPYYTRAYNTNKGTDVDSVFILNYFSKRGTGSSSSTNVAFSKDSKYVAIAGRYPDGSNDGGLFLIYDLETKKL